MKHFIFFLLAMLSPIIGNQVSAATTSDLSDKPIGYLIAQSNEAAVQSTRSQGEDNETAAMKYFKQICPKGQVIGASELSKIDVNNVKAIWCHIDRVNLQKGSLPYSAAQIEALSNFVKQGGNLYLTKQATQLAVKIGRVPAAFDVNIYGNGDGGNGTDVWEINAQIGYMFHNSGSADEQAQYQDRRSHAIYKGMTETTHASTDAWGSYSVFPMLGSGNGTNLWREDHNCCWDFNAYSYSAGGSNTVEKFQNELSATMLGAWGQVVDFACGVLVEFQPMGEYQGRIIANGAAAYEFSPRSGTNAYDSNVKQMTINALAYLSDDQPAVDPSTPDDDTQDEVLAAFPMDVVNGRISDTVSGNDFQAQGASQPAQIEGQNGMAMRLDGYSNYVEARLQGTAFSRVRDAWSVSLTCALETYPMLTLDQDTEDKTAIVTNLNEAQKTGFAFLVGRKGKYSFKTYVNGWAVEAEATEKLPLAKWVNLTATFSKTSGKLSLYLNGELVAQKNARQAVAIGEGSLFIGRDKNNVQAGPYSLNTINGAIDDLTIYNYAVTDSSNAGGGQWASLSFPASHFESDLMRPRFHGMPSGNWSNECHGLVYWNGNYHLFFQKNGNGPYMSRLQWGHIQSPDLLSWQEKPIALYTDQSYDIKGCWSGHVFTDDVLTGGKPNIFYTAVDYAKATICQATPVDDDLLEWQKPNNNPIINGKPQGLSDDFRDCHVFKGDDGVYYMIVGTSKDGRGATTLHRYNQSTKTWSNTGEIFYQAPNTSQGTFWEMPTMEKIDGKWLFTATPQNTSQGVEVLYWTGTQNGNGAFQPENSEPKKFELDGMSKDGYGLLSPSITQHDGKTVCTGIVPDKLAENYNYQLGWAHTYCLPRELSIDANGDLHQRPTSTLASLRGEAYNYAESTLSTTVSMAPVMGRQVEVVGEFTLKASTNEVGFNLLSDGSRKMKISYTKSTNEVTLDCSSLERWVQDGGSFSGVYRSTLPKRIAEGETLKIHAIVDHSIVDVFINDTWAFSVRVFATNANATGVEAFALGEAGVKSLQAYNISLDNKPTAISGVSQEREQPEISAEGGKLSLRNVEPNAKVDIYALDGRLLSRSQSTFRQREVNLPEDNVVIVKVNGETQNFVRKIAL